MNDLLLIAGLVISGLIFCILVLRSERDHYKDLFHQSMEAHARQIALAERLARQKEKEKGLSNET